MASLSCQANGVKIIQFVDIEGRRRTIRLGKTSKRNAERFKLKVESLVFARGQGLPPDDETAQWLAKLDRQLLERLARVGLVADPGETLLIPFIESYIAKREGDIKPRTIEIWNNTLDHVKGFFQANQSIREVTVGDADEFRLHLRSKGLAESTTRKNCAIVKQFFNHAVEHELITANPFRKITSNVKPSNKNKRFITQDVITKVIDACPNAELRAIVALARFGGLRIPSEINNLKWEHILWDESRIVLPSPKTERYEGRDKRVFPLFPELRPYLDDLFEVALPGSQFVCEAFRNRKRDLTHALMAVIRRTGIDPWPRLFHNLRASRQTELQEEFPIHVVCAWLGNTPKVAHESYLQVTEDHFARALQNALQNSERTEHALNDPKKKPGIIVREPCTSGARTGESGELLLDQRGKATSKKNQNRREHPGGLSRHDDF